MADALHMTLPARAENVSLVRHALAGYAQRVGMDEERIGDLKTVVTEACMNVVVHAYENGDGPLEVVAGADEDEITVIVRDLGHGLQPQSGTDKPSLRLGLTLIAALTTSFEIAGGTGRGTRVTARVPLADAARNDPAPGAAQPGLPTASVEVGAAELAGPVLERIFGAVAARQNLQVDRLSDAMLLTDALGEAGAGRFADARLRFIVDDPEGRIVLRIGPLAAGGAEELRNGLRLPGDASLEVLADDVSIESTDDGEYLAVTYNVAE
jgi:anti-sigma regulatory factor (Ser/Thr protein kinase)